jgi:hypothetical protein
MAPKPDPKKPDPKKKADPKKPAATSKAPATKKAPPATAKKDVHLKTAEKVMVKKFKSARMSEIKVGKLSQKAIQFAYAVATAAIYQNAKNETVIQIPGGKLKFRMGKQRAVLDKDTGKVIKKGGAAILRVKFVPEKAVKRGQVTDKMIKEAVERAEALSRKYISAETYNAPKEEETFASLLYKLDKAYKGKTGSKAPAVKTEAKKTEPAKAEKPAAAKTEPKNPEKKKPAQAEKKGNKKPDTAVKPEKKKPEPAKEEKPSAATKPKTTAKPPAKPKVQPEPEEIDEDEDLDKIDDGDLDDLEGETGDGLGSDGEDDDSGLDFDEE